MTAASLSTIAQLPCSETLAQNFAKLIGEIDQLLDGVSHHPYKPSWDCDNVVAFDQPGTRVLLAWSDQPGHGLSGVLTVSVGPSLMPGKPVMRPDAEALCARIVAHLQSRIGAEKVIWHRIACHMTADWVDLLLDTLPEAPPALAQALPAPQPQQAVEQDPRLIALRAALTARTEDAPPLSTPMRLAVHAMNATLIMVWGPVGAAALAHGLIRGENMRMAAHLMVLSGLASAVLHSPKGQSLLALVPAL